MVIVLLSALALMLIVPATRHFAADSRDGQDWKPVSWFAQADAPTSSPR
jgi:hypothetical protein